MPTVSNESQGKAGKKLHPIGYVPTNDTSIYGIPGFNLRQVTYNV